MLNLEKPNMTETPLRERLVRKWLNRSCNLQGEEKCLLECSEFVSVWVIIASQMGYWEISMQWIYLRKLIFHQENYFYLIKLTYVVLLWMPFTFFILDFKFHCNYSPQIIFNAFLPKENILFHCCYERTVE